MWLSMTHIVASNWANCKLENFVNITNSNFIIIILFRVVVTVSLLAEHLGCYKMSLDCKDKLIKFYESLGYVLLPGNSNSMTIRYDGAAVKHNPTGNQTVSFKPDSPS